MTVQPHLPNDPTREGQANDQDGQDEQNDGFGAKPLPFLFAPFPNLHHCGWLGGSTVEVVEGSNVLQLGLMIVWAGKRQIDSVGCRIDVGKTRRRNRVWELSSTHICEAALEILPTSFESFFQLGPCCSICWVARMPWSKRLFRATYCASSGINQPIIGGGSHFGNQRSLMMRLRPLARQSKMRKLTPPRRSHTQKGVLWRDADLGVSVVKLSLLSVESFILASDSSDAEY